MAEIVEALKYIEKVKKALTPEEYRTFVTVLQDFGAERSETAYTIAMVKQLFEGYDGLLTGFKWYVPQGYEIRSSPTHPGCCELTSVHEEFVEFLNKIRLYDYDDDRLYKGFLDIMVRYKDPGRVEREVSTLFQDEAWLSIAFTKFLADTSKESESGGSWG